jgi:hypothetical protein
MKAGWFLGMVACAVASLYTVEQLSAALTHSYSGYGIGHSYGYDNNGTRPTYAGVTLTSDSTGNIDTSGSGGNFSVSQDGLYFGNQGRVGSVAGPATRPMDSQYAGSYGNVTFTQQLTDDSILLTRNSYVELRASGFSTDHAINTNGYMYFAFTPTQTAFYEVQMSIAGNYSFDISDPLIGGYNYKGGNGNLRLFNTAGNVTVTNWNYNTAGNVGGTGAQVNFDASNAISDLRSAPTIQVQLVAGQTYQIDMGGYTYTGGGGSILNVQEMISTVSITAVPEPASLILVGAAVSVGAVYRRRRRSQMANEIR